jgi:hypothetical protein
MMDIPRVDAISGRADGNRLGPEGYGNSLTSRQLKLLDPSEVFDLEL